MSARSLRLAPMIAVVGLGLSLLSPPGAATGMGRSVAPVLTSVTARHVGNVDRVVFSFSGGLPQSVYVSWEDSLVYDGSGLPVRVSGAKVLTVAMNHAVAHDANGATVRARKAFALPNVITAVGAGDFEGTVVFGLGVQKRTSYTVAKLPSSGRVVVEVRADFPTTTRKVWLTDQDANVVPVRRPVPSDAPAAGALRALFGGPTVSEQRDGVRLVRSRAWGFDHLSIVDGIARLRLTRGCSSGGSTTTVASEIMPTLRQFPTVHWVKISGPGGRTEDPTGPSDSIPICLEP